MKNLLNATILAMLTKEELIALFQDDKEVLSKVVQLQAKLEKEEQERQQKAQEAQKQEAKRLLGVATKEASSVGELIVNIDKIQDEALNALVCSMSFEDLTKAIFKTKPDLASKMIGSIADTAIPVQVKEVTKPVFEEIKPVVEKKYIKWSDIRNINNGTRLESMLYRFMKEQKEPVTIGYILKHFNEEFYRNYYNVGPITTKDFKMANFFERALAKGKKNALARQTIDIILKKYSKCIVRHTLDHSGQSCYGYTLKNND